MSFGVAAPETGKHDLPKKQERDGKGKKILRVRNKREKQLVRRC